MQEINKRNLVRSLIPNEMVLESIRSRIRKNPSLPHPLPAVRDKVFNPELKSLTEGILRHSPADSESVPEAPEVLEIPQALRSRFDSLYHGAQLPVPDYASLSLMHIYSNYVFSADSMDPLFRYLLRITGADTLSWMLYDPRMQCHTPVADNGLDSYTRRNFYLGLKDHYLDSSMQSQMLSLRGNLSKEMNFKKRFSTAFYKKFESAFFLNLTSYGVNGFLVLFFRNRDGKEAVTIAEAADGLIRDILPALLRRVSQANSRKRKIQHTSQQIMFQFYRSVREISDSGKLSVKAVFIEPSEHRMHSSFPVYFEQGLERLLREIDRSERMYRIGSFRLAFLLTVTPVERILNLIRELEGIWGFSALVQIRSYPDESPNIVNCHYQCFNNTGETLSSLWRAAEF